MDDAEIIRRGREHCEVSIEKGSFIIGRIDTGIEFYRPGDRKRHADRAHGYFLSGIKLHRFQDGRTAFVGIRSVVAAAGILGGACCKKGSGFTPAGVNKDVHACGECHIH